MTRRLFGLIVAAALASPAAAKDLCSSSDDTLIWSACGDAAKLELRLLPEEFGDPPSGSLDVTGVYTAEDLRGEGLPKPVGLFVRGGEVVSREYVRFDGVLLIDPNGKPALNHRFRTKLGEAVFDLEDPEGRSAFLAMAAAEGYSVAQSHLLIVDGAIDAFPQVGAPAFRRRILFQTADGSYGVYDSTPRVLTLAEATEDVAARFAPVMAINLDMGSFDYCYRGAKRCGALSKAGAAKLSNVLRFSSD